MKIFANMEEITNDLNHFGFKEIKHRMVPTGSKVFIKYENKNLIVQFLQPISAPPLTTNDVQKIESRIKKDMDKLLSLFDADSIKRDSYIHISGAKGKIIFSYKIELKYNDMDKLNNVLKNLGVEN